MSETSPINREPQVSVVHVTSVDPANIPTSFSPRLVDQPKNFYSAPKAEISIENLEADQGIDVLIDIVRDLDGPVPDYIVKAFRANDKVISERLDETESANAFVGERAHYLHDNGRERTEQRIRDATSTYNERRLLTEHDRDLKIAEIVEEANNRIKIESQRASTIISHSRLLQDATVEVLNSAQVATSDVQRRVDIDRSLASQNIERREADFSLIELLDKRRHALPGIIEENKLKLADIQSSLDEGDETSVALIRKSTALERSERAERQLISAERIREETHTYLNNTDLPPAGIDVLTDNILASAEPSANLIQITFDLELCKEQIKENIRTIKVNEKLFDVQQFSINAMEQELLDIPIQIREACLRLVVELDTPVREIERSTTYVNTITSVMSDFIQGKLSKYSGVTQPKTAALLFEAMYALRLKGEDAGNREHAIEDWVLPTFDTIELFSELDENDKDLLKTSKRNTLMSDVADRLTSIKNVTNIGKVARGLFSHGMSADVTQRQIEE